MTSVSILTSHGAMTRETLDFILRVCVSLPHLTELVLTQLTKLTHFDRNQFEDLAGSGITVGDGRRRNRISGLQFITELTSTLASPKYEIERLSVENIEVLFRLILGSYSPRGTVLSS
jgi:hypothetical protein